MPAPQFERLLLQQWPVDQWAAVTVLVAVSGGADSVALLRGLHALKSGKGRLVVAHFNHGLRGAESDADEQFVRRLAHDLGLTCEVGSPQASSPPTAGQSFSDGIAEAAPAAVPEAQTRAARYAFLNQAAQRSAARYVALAHTADDQAETVLQRILRGTGIAGLAGIPRVRLLSPAISLIRPLLELSREEVILYLRELGQPFREDSSNRDLHFARNRIRHELLPLLQTDYYPAVRQSLLRLARQADQAQQALDRWVSQEVGRRVRQMTDVDGPTVTIHLEQISSLPRHVVREIAVAAWRMQDWPEQAMGFDEWDRLAEMALSGAESSAANCSITLPGNIQVRRAKDSLTLCRLPGNLAR